jgi:hypothetical protein
MFMKKKKGIISHVETKEKKRHKPHAQNKIGLLE